MVSSTSKRKRPLRFLLRSLAGVGFFVLVIGLLAFNALLVWVATGPRDLKDMLPYIERSLNEQQSGFTVSVNKGLLLWDGWQHPLDIRLKGVEVKTRDGVRFASFPDVSLGLNLFALTYGKVRPTALIIRRPIVSLYQSPEGAVTFGFPATEAASAPAAPEGEGAAPAAEEPGAQIALMAAIAGFFQGDDKLGLHELKRVEISDASVSVGNAQGVFLRASNVGLALEHGWRGGTLDFDAVIGQEKKNAVVRIDMRQLRGSKQVEMTLRVQSLLPSTVNHFVRSEALSALQAPVSGWINAEVGEDGKLVGGRYTVSIGEGKVATRELVREVAFTQLQAEGQIRPNGIVVEKLSGQLEQRVLSGRADVQWREDGDLALSGDATLKNAKISDIDLFWPPSLAPMSRVWVVTNLKSGDIPQASIRFNIQHDELKAPFLPEQAIEATMVVNNLTASYLPGHEDIRGASGSARVTGKSMEVLIDKATALKTARLANGRVYIDDLNLDNPLIDLTLDAAAPASDMVHLLKLPPFTDTSRLNLDEGKIAGEVAGTAKLNFYYEAPLGPDGKPRADMGVTYDVTANIQQGAQEKFLNKFDVTALSGVMKVNNDQLSFKGNGGVNGAVANVDVEYLFEPRDGFDTFLKVDGKAPVASLKRFGYPEFAFLSGRFGVKADVKIGDTQELTSASFDLKDTVIDWKEAQWSKPAGQPGSLSVKAEKDPSGTRITELNFETSGAHAQGSAVLDDALTGFKAISLSRVKFGQNDLTLNYAAIPGGHRIDAKGASADVSPWMKGESNFSFRNFPALELDVDLGRFYLKADEPVEALKGAIRCTTELCSSADLTGRAGEKPFSVQIGRAVTGPRRIDVRAEDAGAFLNAFDLYDSMQGGTLALNGAYNDADALRPLTGTLSINEFTLENPPTLAKLLTLSSIPSLVDTMQGKGIAFKKLTGPFTLADDVITLKDAKAYGSAIGITADGTVTFPGEVMNIKGTVVPSYTLNTVLGKVPLIGDIITGGGEGVIGVRYSMTGAGDKTDVSVNPLSLLTPGFLRGLFDIFDAPADAPAKKETEENGSIAPKSAQQRRREG